MAEFSNSDGRAMRVRLAPPFPVRGEKAGMWGSRLRRRETVPASKLRRVSRRNGLRPRPRPCHSPRPSLCQNGRGNLARLLLAVTTRDERPACAACAARVGPFLLADTSC